VVKKAARVELKRYPIFADLTEQQLIEVRQILHEKKIAANEIITKEGEHGDQLFLLLSGSVEVSKSLTMMMGRDGLDTRDKSLMIMRAENTPYFGEMALLKEDSLRSATIKAIEECIVGIIHRQDFLDLCRGDSELGFKLIMNIAKTLAIRVEKMNQDILKLTTAFSLALKS
jgi:CRP/FNR family transcriptional regulator, cyclic AMP receptor protein